MKKYTFLIILLAALGACTKDKISSKGEDPYKEQVQPAIYINKNGISPDRARVGEEVTVSGKGFLKNKDKLAILFNGVSAPILELTDTTARVKVPAQAATGNVAAQVDQQYFFGPFFRVTGTFQMDTLFPSKVAANGAIADIIPVEDGKYLVVGDFTDFDNSGKEGKLNRVARINHDGKVDGSFGPDKKNGTNTFVLTAKALPGPDRKYLVAGAFNNYEGVNFVNSIALLNNNGSLAADKIFSPSGKEIIISSLKGGISGQVSNLHVQADGKILLTGVFRFYVQPNYNLIGSVGQDSVHLDSIQINGLVRLMPDGSLDSTYNYDLAKHMGKEGPNGYINRSILLPDGKLLIAGSFTKYNGQAVNRIARLNADGSLDPSFSAGAGPDQNILNMTRQPDGKLIIVGRFNTFGGLKMANVARISENGVIDPSFNVGTGSNGYLFNAHVMPGGEVIVSGIFTEFSGLVRNNMIVLTDKGAIHPTYNTIGGVTLDQNANSGGITQILPVAGEKALLVVGTFTRFDYRDANRFVRITYP